MDNSSFDIFYSKLESITKEADRYFRILEEIKSLEDTKEATLQLRVTTNEAQKIKKAVWNMSEKYERDVTMSEYLRRSAAFFGIFSSVSGTMIKNKDLFIAIAKRIH